VLGFEVPSTAGTVAALLAIERFLVAGWGGTVGIAMEGWVEAIAVSIVWFAGFASAIVSAS